MTEQTPTPEPEDAPAYVAHEPVENPKIADVYAAVLSLTDLVQSLQVPGQAVGPGQIELRA